MDGINGKTKSLAIIGNPLGHSLSPVMHNIFFKSMGLNYVYIPLKVEKEELKKAIAGLWALGFLGANITIPHKEGVIPCLAGVSPEAKLIGAVNTLVRKDNGFWGENTDGKGFLEALLVEKDWQPQGKKIVILGAGGSSKAVAISLALAGAREVSIINRTLSKAKTITRTIGEQIGIAARTYMWDNPGLSKVISTGDIVINTTPLGMEPNIHEMPPIKPQWLSPGQLVVDLIYNPLETLLIREAKAHGCEVSNGLGMLIYQGVMGKEPPVQDKDIKKTLEKYLTKKK